MSFWRKKETNDEVFKRVMELLQLVQTQLAVHDKEIELLKSKIRSKMFREALDESKADIEDPFQDIRAIGKNINNRGFSF